MQEHVRTNTVIKPDIRKINSNQMCVKSILWINVLEIRIYEFETGGKQWNWERSSFEKWDESN